MRVAPATMLLLARGSFGASLLFDPPSIAGTTGFPSDFQGIGGEQSQLLLGKNGDDGGWRGSTDGGKTWSKALSGQQQDIRGDAPGQHAVVAAGPGVLHNMGNMTAVDDKDAGYTHFGSSFVQAYQVEGGVFSTRSQPRHVEFRGLPDPVTCGNSKHLFGCPFRTDGIGHVGLPDGSLVMSVVVYWGGAHASSNRTVRETATSVVAFRSRDGYSWGYAGTILDAASLPQSEEGPNQNDLVLLADNRTLMCVMRVDSGEGPTMRYAPLVRSFSTDWGATWAEPEMFGAGFATGHPRLARMADGQVLLSANQPTPTDRDLLLYWNRAGDGRRWEPHSVSYVRSSHARVMITLAPGAGVLLGFGFHISRLYCKSYQDLSVNKIYALNLRFEGIHCGPGSSSGTTPSNPTRLCALPPP